MRIRRKTSQCPNCGASLDQVYNYCPQCGQENTNNSVSLKTLLGDFFNTYFALDSKFVKTIIPFFIKPGKLTTKYIEGKRASYSHPLRLYLILSIFFFFVLTKAAKKEGIGDFDSGDSKIALRDVEDLGRTTRKALQDNLSEQEIDSILSKVKSDDLEDFKDAINQGLTAEQISTLKSKLSEDAQQKLGLISPDSSNTSLDSLITESTTTLADSTSRKSRKNKSFIIPPLDWKLIEDLKYEKQYSDEAILDSMKLDNLSGFQRRISIQTIRFKRNPEGAYLYILSNLPIMMLLLVPIFAAILKLLYIRRHQLYIKHLILSLYLHAFAYFIYGIVILIVISTDMPSSTDNILITISFVWMAVYAYISYLRVYKQHWAKTFMKFIITGWMYCTFICLFLTSEALISLLLF
ncbi:DUF3667 domain-containing protein [Fulvivirga maritima]|uniref:DUF3667 domain-containing protein n=1 Tax=Fulvivirga maritima TaxID=2904247 RepID=UPI001F332BBD|nr:DUF3667 domain-containing protein [Fulvivirga maritima]UII24729.1 DUF3667 domain-containing protein [Fulvivirga maritima]